MNIKFIRWVAISGYFVRLHTGHISYIKESKKIADENHARLICIINNDVQTFKKYGKVILSDIDRKKILDAIKYIDYTFLSLDFDESVCVSLNYIKPIIFCNGGDRNTATANYKEIETCKQNNIEVIYGVGGTNKLNSSTEILKQEKLI